MGVTQVDEGSLIPEVHSPNMDKDSIRQVLRSLSDAVEATCPCADVRGINRSGQKRDKLSWVDKVLAKILQ